MERAPLDAAWLQRWCVGSPIWDSIEVCEAVDSTNTRLAARAAQAAPTGSVVTAELQTAGKGRAARSWQSPPRAGLAVSVLLRPTTQAAQWNWLPLLAGVVVCQVVSELGTPAALKWPNDLLIGAQQRKAVGILAEMCGDAVVLGIGLNVSQHRDELPREDATSLALEGAHDVDRTRLLAKLLDTLAEQYITWQEAAGDPEASGLAATYRSHCHTLGRQVTVSLPGGGVVPGVAADIDVDGRLCVETADGRQAVAAGDVHHVR